MRWFWQKREPLPSDPVQAIVRELKRKGTPALCEALDATIREMHRTFDILTGQTNQSSTTANPYPTRDERIAQAAKMYRGEADWGNGFVKRIVNIRTAWQMPNGLATRLRDGYEEAPDEEAAVADLLDYNNLAEGKALDLVKNRELEGQLLVQLLWSDADQMVVIRPRPWRQAVYTVVLVDPKNPSGPKRATFRSLNGQVESLEDDQFAFVAFNNDGLSMQGNPEVGDAIWHCESLDRALYAWHKVNNLFGFLTPFFETESPDVANKLQELIKTIGWKIGTAIAANAKFSLVGPPTGATDQLKTECVFHIQMISMLTGIPVYELGQPDLMSNRATAEMTGEPQEIVTNADTAKWLGFFEELFAKAARLHNRYMFTQLDERAIVADIKPNSDRKYDLLVKFWLPAAEKQLIDAETFLDQIPDIDKAAVLERLAGEFEQKRRLAMQGFGLAAAQGGIGTE